MKAIYVVAGLPCSIFACAYSSENLVLRGIMDSIILI